MFGKLFNNLKNGLTKTKNALTDKINETLKLAITIDEDLYEELEEILIMADIGMDTTMEIIDRLKDKIRKVDWSRIVKVFGYQTEDFDLSVYSGEPVKVLSQRIHDQFGKEKKNLLKHNLRDTQSDLQQIFASFYTRLFKDFFIQKKSS